MVLFVTADRLFGQRIKLELAMAGISSLILSPGDVAGTVCHEADDVLVLDLQTVGDFSRYVPSFSVFGKVFLLSPDNVTADGAKTLLTPLPFGALADAVRKKETPLRLSEENGSYFAFFRHEKIALSKTEFHLLRTLTEANGAFVDRETLLKSAFEPGASQSALNVYIHYLREKLERGETRLIVASRKLGYAMKIKEEEVC